MYLFGNMCTPSCTHCCTNIKDITFAITDSFIQQTSWKLRINKGNLLMIFLNNSTLWRLKKHNVYRQKILKECAHKQYLLGNECILQLLINTSVSVYQCQTLS